MEFLKKYPFYFIGACFDALRFEAVWKNRQKQSFSADFVISLMRIIENIKVLVDSPQSQVRRWS